MGIGGGIWDDAGLMGPCRPEARPGARVPGGFLWGVVALGCLTWGCPEGPGAVAGTLASHRGSEPPTGLCGVHGPLLPQLQVLGPLRGGSAPA